MPVRFDIEHKVRHEEWDDVVIPAAEVLANPAAFAEFPDEYEDNQCLDDYPTLFFENGNVHVDEMWGVRDGHIWFSSNAEGVSAIRNGEIVHCTYGRERPLGAFLRLEMRLSDSLMARLTAA